MNRRTEEEFQNRLVQLEKECSSIEMSADGVKSEKSQILIDIEEAEKQIMLTERKIQLAKETIEALDPNVGRAENTKMKQEIHRMELRYVQLKKKQENMIKEMEDAIYRKEQIKAKGKTKLSHSDKTQTAGGFKQGIAGLSQKIEDTASSLDQYNKSITQYQDAYNEKLQKDQHLGQRISELKNKMQDLQQTYEAKVEQKKVMLETIMRNQKTAKMLSKAIRDDPATVQLSFPETELPKVLDQTVSQTEKILSTIRLLQHQVPDLADRLDRVIPMNLANNTAKLGTLQRF